MQERKALGDKWFCHISILVQIIFGRHQANIPDALRAVIKDLYKRIIQQV